MSASLACFVLALLAGYPEPPPRLAFVGLHGGVFGLLKSHEKELGIVVDYVPDRDVAKGERDLSGYDAILVQHMRRQLRSQYLKIFRGAHRGNPRIRVLAISRSLASNLPELVQEGILKQDAELSRYYGSDPENLRRLLSYVLVKYLGKPGKVLPPRPQPSGGLFHPRAKQLFRNVPDFLRFARQQGLKTAEVPRVAVAVHLTHLKLQQPRVVAALIRALEKQGILAVAIVDYAKSYRQMVMEFKPDAMIHLCHSPEKVAFREKIGVPHLHSLFFRKASIDQWKRREAGLASNEIALEVMSQEMLGAIEPQTGAGTIQGGGSEEAFTPIKERMDHLARRTAAWVRLRRMPEAKKRVAVIYWDREMGKGELMRGSATGMFLNGPRSLVRVLTALRGRGYQLRSLPADAQELVDWMQDHGRQMGVWLPGVLERLARSGQAALVPEEAYLRWFQKKVPEAERQAVVKRWGKPPGRFMVWNNAGKRYIVIPRINLGHVVLLPQPLRGEAQDTSLVHDRYVPPPHNYLCTYFWLQETFKANALVHFGTHGSEFMLPGRPVGLGPGDWSDIILGDIPNINPWIVNNLGESLPVRRRAYAVLVDFLTPPSANAGLHDELLALHGDIDKWVTLEGGALKKKFRSLITNKVRREHLDQDLHLDLSGGRLLTGDEIEAVAAYLHNIHNETTPVSLHVLGKPPKKELVVPYLVTCLGKRFLDALATVCSVPKEEDKNPGDRETYLRGRAESLLRAVLEDGLSDVEAVNSLEGTRGVQVLPSGLPEGLRLAQRLQRDFLRTPDEIDHILTALDGKYVPPGPGSAPDMNPGVVPTGRNMFVMNPEEVPSQPSWEVGKELVDALLRERLKKKGHFPRKVGFTLNSFATFQDYGVMESQILYLMGVRPVWDTRNRVIGVKLIPAKKLGRPRIDVFISALGYYRDTLPSRMKLLDKAVRLVAEADEKDNRVRQNSLRVQSELVAKGIPAARAARLSKARIFGAPPGQIGSAGYYYLVERSGEWKTREELIGIYLEHVRYVYTEGLWGKLAPEAYNRHIQGTEVVLRSWSDRTRSPLSNKYVWYKGGSLCLAIKHLTGNSPEFILSDVRDPDRARLVVAEDALRKDFRVRLFNRKWIEGMMKEGYAGADQVATHVSNAFGWEIMREASVSKENWQEIVNIYLHDSRHVNIKQWFEAVNPFAFQEITEVLLEVVRKGYWKPGKDELLNIARAYARSVARHGEGGGLRGGGNKGLEALVTKTLAAPGRRDLDKLLAQYKNKAGEARATAPAGGPAKEAPSRRVEGMKMIPSATDDSSGRWWGLACLAALVLLFLYGLWRKPGALT